MNAEPQTPDQARAELEAEERAERLRQLRMDRELKALLDAEGAPTLTWWDVEEFLAAPRPEPLVEGFLYRDSLATMFGAPGCGKTFLALDMALRIASRRRWAERETGEGPVVYVMAEGQRVNGDRVEAWLERNGATPAELRGRFFVVPHAVLLTLPALGAFLDRLAAARPALVVLDTKNAMLVGDESSNSDWSITRRALDAIRTTCDACVLLVDHSGLSDADRQRGASAQGASMDTSVKVQKAGGAGSPATITATVTRDKAAEEGASEVFDLRMSGPSAVVVHAGPDRQAPAPRASDDEWRDQVLPSELADATGPGTALVPDLARFLAGNAVGDGAKVGISRAEALRGVGKGHRDYAGRQAWSYLLDQGWIEPAAKVTSPTGRHVWRGAARLRGVA